MGGFRPPMGREWTRFRFWYERQPEWLQFALAMAAVLAVAYALADAIVPLAMLTGDGVPGPTDGMPPHP